MRTAGLMMNDIWAHRLMTQKNAVATATSSQPAEVSVLAESVDMLHKGPADRFRPYLHISGELVGVTFPEPLDFGINELTYKPGTGGKIDAYYEFDDEQLVVLARKGYFNADFEVPQNITGVQWQLAAQVDTLAVAPAQEGDHPVVFIKVHDAGKLEIDLGSSGYDLTDYFSDFSRIGEKPGQEATVESAAARVRSDSMTSMFFGDLLLEDADRSAAAGRTPAPGTDTTGPENKLEVELAAAMDAVSQAHAKHGEHLAAIEGTPENLYARRVARSIETLPDELGFIDPLRLQELGLDTDTGEKVKDGTKHNRAEKRAEVRQTVPARPDLPAHLADADEEFSL